MYLIKTRQRQSCCGIKEIVLIRCYKWISSPCIMCVQYIGECSVHQGDIMSTSGGYHEYIGGCSVHRGDTMSTSGDIMSTSCGYHDACGGYHEYIGRYHEYIGGGGVSLKSINTSRQTDFS